MDPENPSYDFICFSDLAYEFNDSDQIETESKIKRRLKYYNWESIVKKLLIILEI